MMILKTAGLAGLLTVALFTSASARSDLNTSVNGSYPYGPAYHEMHAGWTTQHMNAPRHRQGMRASAYDSYAYEPVASGRWVPGRNGRYLSNRPVDGAFMNGPAYHEMRSTY